MFDLSSWHWLRYCTCGLFSLINDIRMIILHLWLKCLLPGDCVNTNASFDNSVCFRHMVQIHGERRLIWIKTIIEMTIRYTIQLKTKVHDTFLTTKYFYKVILKIIRYFIPQDYNGTQFQLQSQILLIHKIFFYLALYPLLTWGFIDPFY